MIAEKLEAMASLGDFNTRMKDFFDIHFLVTNEKLDPEILSQAIRATFERRKTALPASLPDSLKPEFAKQKQAQWAAFLNRNNLKSAPKELSIILQQIREKLPIDWENLK